MKLETFNSQGATFDVKKDDIIRVAIQAGYDQSADGNFVMNPTIEYVEYPVESVSNFVPEIEVKKGSTVEVDARVNPYYLEAPIALEVADGETYASAEYAPAGMKVKLDEYEYREVEKGTVDITFSAAEDSTLGTGYYRLKFGDLTRLIAVTVVGEEDTSDEEDEEEPGISFSELETSDPGEGEGGGSEGGEGEGGGSEGGEGGEVEPPFVFEFNSVDETLTILEDSITLPAGRNTILRWKHSNADTDTKSYYVFAKTPAGGSTADIDLTNILAPTKEIEIDVAGSDSEVLSSLSFGATLPNGATIDMFWLYGGKNDLAKNGLRVLHNVLNHTYTR